MEEVFAGCERPAFSTLDAWRWRTPHSGYYYTFFGNEKAWIVGVEIEFDIFRLLDDGKRERISEFE